MFWIGLISGTSADGIDAALVRIEGLEEIQLRAYRETPLEESLRARIQALGQGSGALRELLALDGELGLRFAHAALAVASEAGVEPREIEGIGLHGQTVAHHPEPGVRGSLQVGSAAVVHEHTGIPVVADFRSADLAAGGQGAPLTPYFHHAYFARADEVRAVLNIGGFTNVSYLPDLDAAHVIAFDPGPGNALLDRAVRWATQGSESFDRDGERAARGTPDVEVVRTLLGDAYFAEPPPKSTGHERFGGEFFERVRERVLSHGGGAEDLLATLTRFTAESARDQAERFFPTPPERWIVYGGGVRNATLLNELRTAVAPAPVETSDAHGIPADALEAVAFAVLGWCAVRGEPANLPPATGARRAVVLGVQTPPGGLRA